MDTDNRKYQLNLLNLREKKTNTDKKNP
jgi:hypothetical protein